MITGSGQTMPTCNSVSTLDITHNMDNYIEYLLLLSVFQRIEQKRFHGIEGTGLVIYTRLFKIMEA